MGVNFSVTAEDDSALGKIQLGQATASGGAACYTYNVRLQ